MGRVSLRPLVLTETERPLWASFYAASVRALALNFYYLRSNGYQTKTVIAYSMEERVSLAAEQADQMIRAYRG